MYNKPSVPDVTYEVTLMDHSSRDYTAAAFREQLQDDRFIADIQMFKRYLWTREGDGRRHYTLDQEPCLIVKELVPVQRFDEFGCASLYHMIQEGSHIYDPDHFVVTYCKTIEAIRKCAKIFNRNLDLLFPLSEASRATQSRLANAEALCVTLGRLDRSVN